MTGQTSTPGIVAARWERLISTIDRAAGDDTRDEGRAV
jgi:hypothetical protein